MVAPAVTVQVRQERVVATPNAWADRRAACWAPANGSNGGAITLMATHKPSTSTGNISSNGAKGGDQSGATKANGGNADPTYKLSVGGAGVVLVNVPTGKGR